MDRLGFDRRAHRITEFFGCHRVLHEKRICVGNAFVTELERTYRGAMLEWRIGILEIKRSVLGRDFDLAVLTVLR